MKKPAMIGQNSGSKSLWLLSLLLIMNILYSIALYGCASSRKKTEVPAIQMDAIEFNHRGVEAVAAADYRRALIEFKKALILNESIDNLKGNAVNLINIGRLYLLAEKFDEAKGALEQAVNISMDIHDEFIVSEAYASMGRYYYLTGRNREAMEILEKAVRIDLEQGYNTIASRLNIMGMIHRDSGELDKAEDFFSRALTASKRYGADKDASDSFRGMGDILVERGDYRKAREMYESALSLDRKIGDSMRISHDLFALGMLSMKENNLKVASGFFVREYNVNKSRGDNKRALKSLDNLIEIYKELGDEGNMMIYSQEKERILADGVASEREGDRLQ